MKNLFSEKKKKRLSDLKLSLSLPVLHPMRCQLQSAYFQMHETLPAKRGVQIPLLPEKHIQLSCPPTPLQPWTREDVSVGRDESRNKTLQQPSTAVSQRCQSNAKGKGRSSTDNTRTLGVHTQKCHSSLPCVQRGTQNR